MSYIGSPPRGRGKVSAGSSAALSFRIAPAWAGKRRPQQRHRMALQDHPRVGGEKPEWAPITFLMLGSPPHGQGKGHDFDQIGRSAGITPAWAGKSGARRVCVDTAGDHPRMGGEKFIMACVGVTPIGSPPHGRGKATWNKRRAPALGITPAWAGERHSLSRTYPAPRDHPRMGGEKRSDRLDYYFPQGSPPHGRGKGCC